jgi:hypothetical protein
MAHLQQQGAGRGFKTNKNDPPEEEPREENDGKAQKT